MKIGNLNHAADTAAITGDRKASTPAKSTGSASSAPASAQVELSATASLLSQGGTDPTFDAAKVERIAQAIKDGKFKVNPEAIADKLIANAQELLGRSGSGH
jgi:negative regulator of flagellin synthesis FlgM